MKRMTRYTLLFLLVLLTLALAASPATPLHLLAQSPETEEEGAVHAPPMDAIPQSSAEIAQPDLDWYSSSEPGYVSSQGQPLAPEEMDATTRDLRVVGSALKPRDSNVEWASSGSGGCAYASSGSASTVWNVPVYLPQGSTVTAMRMYVNDTSTSNCWGWFTVYDLYGDLVDEWGVASSTTAGEAYFQVSIPDHVIDYSVYSYVFNWRPYDTGSDMQLCGFRLFYIPPIGAQFLPVVMRNHP